MLKENGYNTAGIGKWHLGWTWANSEEGVSNIDYFYGIPASLDMVPSVYVENDRSTSIPMRITKGDNIQVGDPGYTGAFWREGATVTDFDHEDCLPNLVRRATKYIGEKAKNENPYSLYHSMA